MPKSNAGGPGRGSMGALGAPPGHVLGALGALLGTLGALLGALGDALGRSWDALGHLLNASCKKTKQMKKKNIFFGTQLGPQNGAKLEPKSIKKRC